MNKDDWPPLAPYECQYCSNVKRVVDNVCPECRSAMDNEAKLKTIEGIRDADFDQIGSWFHNYSYSKNGEWSPTGPEKELYLIDETLVGRFKIE